MRGKELRKFIISNNKLCALLIGNGINRYANSGCSWDDLLKALAKVYCPSLGLCDEIPYGISNTEFFDILEINLLKETPTFDLEKIKEEIIKQPLNKISDNLSPELINKIIQFNSQMTPLSEEDFKNNFSERVKSMRSIFTPDFRRNMELAINITTMGDKFKTLLTDKLVNAICNHMKKWTFSEAHKKLALFAKKYDLPILTTNYDNLLADSIGAEFIDFGSEFSSESNPISCCYKCNNPKSQSFGIWHINGTIKFTKSILIGLTHYMRSIEHIRKMILPPNRFNTELFMIDYWSKNPLRNTWIEYIFSRHLVIAGISLNKDEVFLRWLLLERAKFFALFPHFKKEGFYILPDNENISTGKEYFFNSVGINIVRVQDYQSIYRIIS